MEKFTESLSEDYRLYRQDIQGSMAHARALSKAGLLTARELQRILRGLKQIEKEIGELGDPFRAALDEDIHSYIERRLTEKIGSLGGKLHTGRSRNDQVVLSLKLYLREKVQRILREVEALQKALVRQAEKQIGILLPGYTHLQRGQPVLLSHHLLAYYEMMERDRMRFGDCLKRLHQQMPLGVGAVAGNSFSINRLQMATELGFEGVTENSIDTVSDRDFIAEFYAACAILMVHLSRWAEEWILWASSEFGFMTLPDTFCTGSSMMPHKKNPDVLELIRGKAGRVFGAFLHLLTLLKGLPLSYNRDLQEDKRGLFDTVETVEEACGMMTLLVPHVHFVEKQMEEAARDPLLLATDLADYLVVKGIPFRKAHQIVGKMVQKAEAQNKPFHQWSLSQFQRHTPLFGGDLLSRLTPRASVESKKGIGGTSTKSVKAALKRIKSKWQRA